MKNKFILICAVLVAVVATYFVYVLPQTSSVPSETSSTSSAQATSQATLKVGDKTYPINVVPNETVIDAMNTLASTSDFTYTSKDYPGIGAFVDSINGQKNSSSMYWILFLNGTTTMSGASATNIGAGDVAEWKYEKGY